MFSQLRNEDGKFGLSSLTPKTLINVTTGISSLDAILGNGFPLGSLVLLEEDEYGIYSRIFSKCFMSEGIANTDSIFLACRDENPKRIISDLPQVVPKREDIQQASIEDLKIAWRYKNNQQVVSVPCSLKNSIVSHEFDFSCKLQGDTIKKSNVCIWPESISETSPNRLLQDILKIISSRKSLRNECRSVRKLTRIVIQSLGSPFWSLDRKSIFKFLYILRTIVHNSNSVALVTIPSKILDYEVVDKCKQLCDIVISLKSFQNSTDPSLNEFSGLIKFLKISAINSFSINVPEDFDWSFKVKKKKLIIEKLHLPPESNVTDQREQDDFASVSIPSCRLDF